MTKSGHWYFNSRRQWCTRVNVSLLYA